MFPEKFKPKEGALYWLTWPSGTAQKITALDFFGPAFDRSIEEDSLFFFFFEDRRARLPIGRIERDSEKEFSFTVLRLPGHEDVGVVTVTEIDGATEPGA